jgi:hypothetical protein
LEEYVQLAISTAAWESAKEGVICQGATRLLVRRILAERPREGVYAVVRVLLRMLMLVLKLMLVPDADWGAYALRTILYDFGERTG